jgi:multicomponent Na+:H+ antiporter subunit E
MRHFISFCILLAGLWLALSGHTKPLLLGLGVVSVMLVAWLSHRMDVLGAEHDPALFSWRLPIYWGWLIGQIVIANLEVAACIFRPSRLSPQLVELAASQQSQVARVTYGNSITLTPGTVTLSLDGNRLAVHALTRSAADGLREGTMERWVNWLETGQGGKTEP